MSIAQNTFAPIASPGLVCGTKPASNLVRFSLLSMTILAGLFSATFATIGIVLQRRLDVELNDVHRMALYLHIFISVVFAGICSLGLITCIAKHRSAASIFTSLVVGQILFSLGSGILSLCLLFDVNTSVTPSSHQEPHSVADGFVRSLSQNMPVIKGAVTAMFVIIWLVEIATIVLGNAFLGQLDKAARGEEYDPKYDIDDVC